jgi:hypothetical protein
MVSKRGWRGMAVSLEEAIEQAKKGNAILFTGAGFSRDAISSRGAGKTVPTATEFASSISEMLGIEKAYPLQTVAEYFLSQRGAGDLVRILLDNFSIASVREHHKVAASLPWRRVYTTNYDNCFEVAASQVGSEWTPTTIDMLPNSDRGRCVHINGHISHLTPATVQSQVKLTHSSYSSESFSNSKWSQQLRQDMSASKAVFFVGYSLYDIDISRILFEYPELKDRTHFITSSSPDPVANSILVRYGSVHAIGVEEWAKQVNLVSVKVLHDDHDLTWLKQYDPPLRPIVPDDVSAVDLILKGVVREEMLAWSLASEEAFYAIRREEIDRVAAEVRSNRKWIVVHSDLGNGKSIFKEQLSFILANSGFSVFWDTDFDLNKREDILYISSSKERVVIMIDEGTERISTIELLQSFSFRSATFIVFVRSTAFQLGEKRYENVLPDDFAEVDINRLTDREVSKFVDVLDALGLWGDLSALNRSQKETKIRGDFDASIQKVVISIFDNSEVGKRIVSEARAIMSENSKITEVLLLTFILVRLGDRPNPTILSEMMPGTDVWRLVRSSEFSRAGEFIRYENGLIKSRSSILSNVLLRRVVKPEYLISVIERTVRHLAAKNRGNSMHHVFTELMRFPILEGMITGPRAREIIIGYFQAIKDMSFCKTSADFWLHYAMARLTFGDFGIAEKYFATAKSLARSNPKKLTDVNNHYARLLLESRIKTDSYDDHFKAFEAAHAILLSQMNKDDNKHYPYRQAKNYVEFISYRRGKLSPHEISRFIVACQQVKSAIRNLSGRLSHSIEVIECERNIDRAIEIAEGGR